MIFLVIARPRPVPDDLVEKLGTKILSRSFSGIPRPKSRISVITFSPCLVIEMLILQGSASVASIPFLMRFINTRRISSGTQSRVKELCRDLIEISTLLSWLYKSATDSTRSI